MVSAHMEDPDEPITGNIILKIEGLKKIKGELRCRIYDSEENFPSKSESKMFRLLVVPVTSETAEIVIENLPFGNYGIVVHHDRNSNGKSDKTWYRAPKEPVACSNGAKGNFGPPKWSDAVFELNQESLDIPINFK
jgi:uncharacterized protein (DUF2141 family)